MFNNMHIVVKTPEAVSRNGLKCQVCRMLDRDQNDRTASKWAAMFVRLLHQTFPCMAVAAEVCCQVSDKPSRNKKALDFWIASVNGCKVDILVEVDGQGHIDSELRNKHAKEQADEDAEHMQYLFETGRRCVVRVHYNDIKSGVCVATVTEAVNLYIAGKQPFIMYTPSYWEQPRFDSPCN